MQHQSVIGCVLSPDKKKILFVKRRDVPIWVLPGGKMEEKESPQEAIIREIKEETGYEVMITRKVGEYVPGNKLTKFTHLFECTITSGMATLGKETKEISFFSVNALPKLLPPPFRKWIKDTSKQKASLIKGKIKEASYLSLLKNCFSHPILMIRFLLAKVGFPFNS